MSVSAGRGRSVGGTVEVPIWTKATKRSLVILRPEEYEDWLGARSTDEARSFLNLFPAEEMYAEAAPKPPKSPAPKPDDDAQASLLG